MLLVATKSLPDSSSTDWDFSNLTLEALVRANIAINTIIDFMILVLEFTNAAISTK